MSIVSQSSATQVRELPRLFKALLVHGIRKGQKTETRQPLKPQPLPGLATTAPGVTMFSWKGDVFYGTPDDFLYKLAERCPLGKVGDRLWVKETIYGYLEHKIGKNPPKNWDSSKTIYDWGTYWYAADELEHPRHLDWTVYTSAIHCPRWAARLILEITEVRVERLQEITARDALAEGISIYEGDRLSLPEEGRVVERMYLDQFQKLWNGIYAADGYGWDANPFVWVQKFKVLQGGVE